MQEPMQDGVRVRVGRTVYRRSGTLVAPWVFAFGGEDVYCSWGEILALGLPVVVEDAQGLPTRTVLPPPRSRSHEPSRERILGQVSAWLSSRPVLGMSPEMADELSRRVLEDDLSPVTDREREDGGQLPLF